VEIDILQIYIRVTEYYILLMFNNMVRRSIVEHEREEFRELKQKAA
jgi:hypothetical protein